MPEPRLYFRQLLSGRDFARDDPIAQQMLNFVYLIGDTQTRETLIVDPAYRVAELIGIAEADDMRVVGALGTHYHPDHIGGDMMGFSLQGVRELLDLLPVKVHVQRDEVPWVKRVTEVSDSDLAVHDSGDIVTVGAVEVTLIHTPGHTPGSQCFFVDGRLIAGDTLFLEGCGRTDLPGGDAAALYRSVHDKLAKIPDDAILFPGHRYAPQAQASMGETRRTNYVFKPKTEAEWLAMFGG